MKQYNTNYRISLAYVLNTMLCLIFIFPMRMNGGTLLGELSLSNDFLSVGDINVSVLCPKGGINGSNKYTLNMAITKIPSELRKKDVRCSFINASGSLETWVFNGGTWSDVKVWRKEEMSSTFSLGINSETLIGTIKRCIAESNIGKTVSTADEEDITSVDNGNGIRVLKRADRKYNPLDFSGKGYKILRKHIVLGKNVLTQAMMNEPNTTYVIQYDYDLDGGELIVPQGSTLQFEGGSLQNGCIKGCNTNIRAGLYQIFKSISFKGDFSNHFYVEWMGAIGDGNFDNAPIFNVCFNSNILNWEGNGRCYYLASPVMIKTLNQTIKLSNVETNGNYDAFVITKHWIQLDIHSLRNRNKIALGNASAIKLSNNVYNATFNIFKISNFNKGINLYPRVKFDAGDPENATYSGIQYCVFTWQHIEQCDDCIVFDVNGADEGKGLWINENQFNGGRLSGKNGIMQYGRGNKFDAINGNVFNSIGFEDIDCPIKSLYKWSVDRFNYIRMSESIRNSTYIEMDNCTNVLIDLKSYVEASKFKIKDCNTTEIRSMYSVYQYNQKSYDVKKQYSNYQQQNKSFLWYYDHNSKGAVNKRLQKSISEIWTEGSSSLDGTINCSKIINLSVFLDEFILQLDKRAISIAPYLEIYLSGGCRSFIVEDAKGNVIYSTHRPKKKIQISFNNELTPMIFDEDLNHSFVHKKAYFNSANMSDLEKDITDVDFFTFGTSGSKPSVITYSKKVLYSNFKLISMYEGRCILKNEQNETYPIDEPGIYLLTISSDDALEVTKLSKVEAVNTKCVGSFQEKPLNSAIGFSYFCTDRKTTEGSTTGIMIYHKGNNIWVDALGREIK